LSAWNIVAGVNLAPSPFDNIFNGKNLFYFENSPTNNSPLSPFFFLFAAALALARLDIEASDAVFLPFHGASQGSASVIKWESVMRQEFYSIPQFVEQLRSRSRRRR
jgi:hypothetical protein